VGRMSIRCALVVSWSLAACSPTEVVGGPAVVAEPDLSAVQVPFARDDRDGVRAALKQAGVAFGAEDCIAWPASFPRVVVLGSVVDGGCVPTGTFVDRRHLGSNGEAEALATRGFAGAKLADKEAIARAWVDEAVHAFGDRFAAGDEPAFTAVGAPKVAPVVVRMNKIGGVVVEGWVAVRSSQPDRANFTLRTYRFAADGALEIESKQDLTGPAGGPPEAAGGDPPSYSVDMTGFDLACQRDADCVKVRPHMCGVCGCENTALAKRHLEAFQRAAAAIVCPPPEPLTGGAGCGGCPGYHARCEKRACVVEAR
jgi:hypothetical protein